jgi:hypothetical protein
MIYHAIYILAAVSLRRQETIEIEEDLGCAPIHKDITDEETKRVQYVTVDQQEPAEFGLVIARRKPVHWDKSK